MTVSRRPLAVGRGSASWARGNVDFGGEADAVDVSVAGSGDVRIAKANGLVSKHVAGSGDVIIGR